MTVVRATIKVQGERVRGLWEGGQYIDLHFVRDGSSVGYPESFEAINLIHGDGSKEEYPLTDDGVRQALEAWAKTLEPGELPNYRANISKDAGGPF